MVIEQHLFLSMVSNVRGVLLEQERPLSIHSSPHHSPLPVRQNWQQKGGITPLRWLALARMHLYPALYVISRKLLCYDPGEHSRHVPQRAGRAHEDTTDELEESRARLFLTERAMFLGRFLKAKDN